MSLSLKAGSPATIAPMQREFRTEISYRHNQDSELVLLAEEGVFVPTHTTSLLIQAVSTTTAGQHTILDLGCGTGVVGLSLYLRGLVRPPIHASDLSLASVRCCKHNFARYNCEADVRSGSLFDPWAGELFDIIVDDVSGIAQEVAAVSPWFHGVPCESGADGLALVSTILKNAPQYLNKGGRFFFPVLSLSNVDRLLRFASESFATVKQILRQEWPLPPDLLEHLPLLRKLASDGKIQLNERFGMATCFTEVYCAYNS